MPTPHVTLGKYAHGTIEPQPRIASGEITEQEVDRFVEELKGNDFYDEIHDYLPIGCVDGRDCRDGSRAIGANAAGGVFTLLAADMLTNQTYRSGAKDTEQYAAQIFAYLNQKYPGQFGDHDSDSVDDPRDSGCGAIDRMPVAIGLIAEHGDDLRIVAGAVGIHIEDDDFKVITERAQHAKSEHGITIASGADMIGALRRIAGTVSAETLADVHNEVVVVINERQNTTLDRAKVKARYDNRLQAFNYDRWAMRKAVRTITQAANEDEARLKLAAADLYNIAVTCTLAGPSLRAVVRS